MLDAEPTMADTEQIAGRYRVESELARGGVGIVYRALDTSSGKRVALKRLLATTASSKHQRSLFQREYHTLLQLQHPRIIEVYDYGVDAEGPYYTMELLDGRDLRELAPLDWRASCQHLRDVASSLALLHARRLIHRDLSARNVRLTNDGRAKLIDFGALTTFGVPSQVVGTPPLVPPEALHGQAIDQRADLYALGTLAYWLLTGRHAYPAPSLQALPDIWLKGAPIPASKMVPKIPRELDELVTALLSLDAAHRPNSAAEVIERLNAIAGLESEELLDAGHSYLSNPSVVGRDRELERLRRFVERVTGGHSVSLVIEGESGVGKTRLLEELGVEAQLKGATVLRVDAENHRGPYAVARALSAALLVKMPDIAVECGRPYVATLGHLIPELRERLSEIGIEKPSSDLTEQRIRVQTALAEWLRSVARRRPLLLALDNAQAADEASLALLVTLPRQGQSRPIGVVATLRSGEGTVAPAMLETLRENAGRVTVGGLGAEQTIALVKALFGDVDHAGRLGQWLRDRTDGNPMQCIALATQLIADDVITYKDGAWVLPSELSREQLATGMQQVFERRVAQLSENARSIGEAVSIERGKFSIEQAIALTQLEGRALFDGLDELVSKNVLVAAGEDYRFSQVALQRQLESRLTEERRRELHRRAGEFLLNSNADDMSRVDAGWHLLHGGDQLRGAHVLLNVGHDLLRSTGGLAFAAPGLEVALEVLEKHGEPKWPQLSILEFLSLAGWFVDRKYALKYGERCIKMALELSGLELSTTLSSVFGRKLALPIGVVAGGVRHGIVKRKIGVERYRKFEGIFSPLLTSLAVMVGVAANSFDPVGARKYLNASRILQGFPKDHVVHVMYDYARYYTLATEGRLGEALPIGLRVLEWLESDASPALGEPVIVRSTIGGQMTGIATYAAVGGRREALDWAEKLEKIGLSFYGLMATRVRFMYHVIRGELPKAAPYREQLELNAIQGGATWQTSLLIPFTLGITYASTGEVARLRQAADELERLAREVPSLDPPARLLRASYHHWRGRPSEALPLFESVIAEMPPRTHLLWALARANYGRALIAAGRADDALKLCREAAKEVDPSERLHSLLYTELEFVLAVAEAETGDPVSAGERLDAVIAELEPSEVPLMLALAHEARARVARLAGDSERWQREHELALNWAKVTENTALIGKYKHMESQWEGVDGSIPSQRLAGAITSHVSAIRTVLDQYQDVERARAALRLMLESSEAAGGYLYLGAPPNLRLVAQFPEDTPPSHSILANVLDLAAAVHQPTDFLEDTGAMTLTAGLGETGDERSVDEEMTAQLLIIPDGGRPKVIGAIALKPGAGRISFEVLEAVAKSLNELGN